MLKDGGCMNKFVANSTLTSVAYGGYLSDNQSSLLKFVDRASNSRHDGAVMLNKITRSMKLS